MIIEFQFFSLKAKITKIQLTASIIYANKTFYCNNSLRISNSAEILT